MSRRRNNVRQYSAEDQALTDISKEAENRLAAKRAARAEAREIRMKEIERQQKEAEEKEKLTNDNGMTRSRQLLTAAASSSSGVRDSDESSEGAGGDSYSSKARDLKMELRSLDEKYKTAMMTSAQLDNERQSLVYQVELLKDQLEEQAESHTELQREYKDKNRDCELTKRELQAAQLALKGLREQMEYKDRLIAESGLIIVAAEDGELILERSNEAASTNGPVGSGGLLLSSEALDLLNKSCEGSLDDKVKALAGEKRKLLDEIKRLETLLDDAQVKQKKSDNSQLPQVNGPEMQLYEVQREASKQIHDYKFKLQKAEQDIATLEGMVGRLETQVRRYKSDAERAEAVEDELKQEKRKLQRELREAQTQVEELQNQNKHLTIRLDRIKQSRTAFGIQ